MVEDEFGNKFETLFGFGIYIVAVSTGLYLWSVQGLLADGAREYSEKFNRRWLVTSYEAGDVVLHNPFAVSSNVSHRDTYCRKQPLATAICRGAC